jgi:hypothetical protein
LRVMVEESSDNHAWPFQRNSFNAGHAAHLPYGQGWRRKREWCSPDEDTAGESHPMQDLQHTHLMVKGEGGRESDAHQMRAPQENLIRCKTYIWHNPSKCTKKSSALIWWRAVIITLSHHHFTSNVEHKFIYLHKKETIGKSYCSIIPI